jgi:cysteinyl-tRNA synthetase
LWESYEVLKKLPGSEAVSTSASAPTSTPASAPASTPASAPASAPADADLDAKVNRLLDEMDESMNDDFNTAKVLANLFELAPVVNGIKDGHVKADAISSATYARLNGYYKAYLEDVLGLQDEKGGDDQLLQNVLQLLIELRKEARTKKDYATSDKIRNQLLDMGVMLKDEKDGNVSFTIN